MLTKMVCKQCGQQIWGRYVTALGATWHPEHFVCAGCGRPFSGAEYMVHEGRPYHTECYRDLVAPRCAACGKPLVGQYLVHEGRSYHADCYRDTVALRCAYCNKPLLSEYLVDHWGTKYCREHQGELPKCAFCGRLVPPEQQEAGSKSNGDVRCPVCRGTAVESNSRAQSILVSLRRWLGDRGLTYENLPLTVELCDRARLTTLLKDRAGTHTLGVTMSSTLTQNGQEVRTDITGVAVLRGMPVALFQGVTVHELGHVWLIINGIKDLPEWAEEGFCELLAYRFYNETTVPESLFHAGNIEKNPDSVYGEGFRRVRAIADKVGFRRFVETLRTTKRMP